MFTRCKIIIFDFRTNYLNELSFIMSDQTIGTKGHHYYLQGESIPVASFNLMMEHQIPLLSSVDQQMRSITRIQLKSWKQKNDNGFKVPVFLVILGEQHVLRFLQQWNMLVLFLEVAYRKEYRLISTGWIECWQHGNC